MRKYLSTLIIIIALVGIGAFIFYGESLGQGFSHAGSVESTMTSTKDDTDESELPEDEIQETKELRSTPDENISDENLRATVLPENNILFPDIVIADPETVAIETGEDRKNLRFDTTFANLGEGDLRIYSTEKEEGFVASQILETEPGQEYHVNIGKFEYKDEHEHWHLANFANYELWNFGEDGERDELLSSNVKISFCIWDYGEFPEGNFDVPIDIVDTQARQFPECNYELQGLTVGWYDKYEAFTQGQSIDIREIPDGQYMLRTIINVEEDVYESSYENNESFIYIEIEENSVSIIDLP